MWRQAFARPHRSWAHSKITGAIPSGTMVDLYQVKVDQPRFHRTKKAALYIVVAYSCAFVWRAVVDNAIGDFDPRTVPDDPRGAEETPEPMFLPFPFTEKQVIPQPYAGAEEEWKSFIKFNKDSKLKERVRNDVKMLVKRAAERNPTTKRWAKNGETFKLGHTWLIFSFPERPPAEFVRTGIELGGERGIEIKTKKLEPMTKALLDRVLMPYPIASASYAFVKAMTIQNVSTVAKYIGLSSGGKELNISNPDPEFEKTLKKLQAKQTAGGSTSAKSSTASAPAQTTDTPAPESPENRAKITPSSAADRHLPKVVSDYLAMAGSKPWAAFKDTYRQTWKPLKCSPPRGSLAVHGMVALESPKGRVYIDVFAWYHPKTDKFHAESLVMNLRAITPYNQKPRR